VTDERRRSAENVGYFLLLLLSFHLLTKNKKKKCLRVGESIVIQRARARHGRERLGVFHHFFFLPPVCIDEPPRVKWWKGKKKTKFL
jgi:hypothetical protein